MGGMTIRSTAFRNIWITVRVVILIFGAFHSDRGAILSLQIGWLGCLTTRS
jgi:hypothetical protein